MKEKNKLFEESIILIGPSGAGKSTIAEILKNITGMPRLCLDRVANRDTSSQYFNHQADETDQYYTGRQEISNQDYLGQVIEYDNETKLIKFYERNYFEVGDSLELFTPSGEIISFNVEKLFDENKESIDVARHPDNIYYIYLDTDIYIPEYSMIRLIKKRAV